jgi:hypothetical protein
MSSPRWRWVSALPLLTALLSCGEGSNAPTSGTQPTPIPAACAFAISPATASFASTGGTQVVNVTTTPAGCSPTNWTATATAGLTLSPTSGSGNGLVTVTAEANTGPAPRTMTATIAGQPFAVTLQARACTYAFTANGPDLGNDTWMVSSDAGDRFVTVTVSPNDGTCPAWRANASAGWVAAEPASGTTSARVQIEFDDNDGATPRTGRVSFTPPDCTGSNCGLTVTVSQAGRASFTLKLTLEQGQNLSGPYAGTVTGPNGLTCSIRWNQATVDCPPAAFADGAAVELRVVQTSVPGDGNIFSSNTRGCDAIRRSPDGSGICTVNMDGDRDVVIGVGCSSACAGFR